jgi:transposase
VALHVDGLTAPTVVDGPMTDNVVAYVDQQLITVLKPGDVVVMDNLSSHRRAAMKTAIEDAGAELRYLPPYGPDLNPLEKAFSKLKAELRASELRTVPDLEEYLGQPLDAFSPEGCQNDSRNCGYPVASSGLEPL